MSVKPETVYGLSMQEFINWALLEDEGDGDHTSISTIEEGSTGQAVVRAKEKGIIAGVALAEAILKHVDERITHTTHVNDGSEVEAGKEIMHVQGSIRSLLKAERLLLNCMQRMSGIATKTRHLIQKIEGTKAKILDTRKTTPNFRYFEKWAVQFGGGINHRYGLYDMILIKDNHIDACGGSEKAIDRANEYLASTGRRLKIEIETRNLDDVRRVLKHGKFDRIMLDNFKVEDLKEAVSLVDGKFETEASGGITEENIRAIAETGVDFISVGALTHSYKSLDISMKIVS